jgi:hypothetical protein
MSRLWLLLLRALVLLVFAGADAVTTDGSDCGVVRRLRAILYGNPARNCGVTEVRTMALRLKREFVLEIWGWRFEAPSHNTKDTLPT